MRFIAFLLYIGIFVVAPFVAAYNIGKTKNRRGWIHWLLGGWIGVIILACQSPAVDPALVDKERRVRELELDARLAALETSSSR